MIDKATFTTMSTRQKAIAGGVLVLIVILIWQLISMFGGSKTPPAKPPTTAQTIPPPPNGNGPPINGAGPAASASTVPQAEQMTTSKMTNQQQAELMRLQQETQQKYIIALNELQMLKLAQQIAETNKDIASAKLATVTAQKGIVDLLTKPAPVVETPASFSPGLITPNPSGTLPIQPVSPPPPGGTVSVTTSTSQNANYVVISVSELVNRWSAVLGYQGKLYSVLIGDVLPPDQSMVIGINKFGVTLEKDGVQRKVSLVPII